MTQEEVLENVENSLWFTAYSCAFQRVGEAACSRRWQWARGKAPEIGVSPLVRVSWEETGIELAASCTKLCWELPLRGVFRRRERGAVSHAITFMDDMAVHIPSLDVWDQFVWLPGAAMPQATTQVEQYSYPCSHAIDLSPVMPATQFRVTDKAGTYLCAAWALVFEGSVLAYNPARDKSEWVPTHGIANDLSWTEEKSAVALANYVPHISQEAARIAGLRTHCLVSWMTPPQRRRRRKMNRRRKRNMRKQRDREKQAPNRHPAAQCSSKARWSKRPNHGDDDDRRSGGLSWMRKNLSLLMTRGRTLMPQMVAAPLYVQPRRSRGCRGRLQLRCMPGSQRWRNSELVGREGRPVLTSVNLYFYKEYSGCRLQSRGCAQIHRGGGGISQITQ